MIKRDAAITYIDDWSEVPHSRYRMAQEREKTWWSLRDPDKSVLEAKFYYYAGYYEWSRNRSLLNPFRVAGDCPQNFQLPGSDLEGKSLLDIGCGPVPITLSLVHCADIHVIDPLLEFYTGIQQFGWQYFSSRSSGIGESLPYGDRRFDYVYCWNVLDHTRDAETILREISRVLKPAGRLLFGCDARAGIGGGEAHPYMWSVETLEKGISKYFTAVNKPTLIDPDRKVIETLGGRATIARWVCHLQKI